MRFPKGALLALLVVAGAAMAKDAPLSHGTGTAVRAVLPAGLVRSDPAAARAVATLPDTWNTLFSDNFEGAFPGSWQVVNQGETDAGWGRGPAGTAIRRATAPAARRAAPRPSPAAATTPPTWTPGCSAGRSTSRARRTRRPSCRSNLRVDSEQDLRLRGRDGLGRRQRLARRQLRRHRRAAARHPRSHERPRPRQPAGPRARCGSPSGSTPTPRVTGAQRRPGRRRRPARRHGGGQPDAAGHGHRAQRRRELAGGRVAQHHLDRDRPRRRARAR